MKKVTLRCPLLADEQAFLQAIRRSQSLHNPWVFPPSNKEDYLRYLDRISQKDQISYFVCTEDNCIAGVFNISEIVRGCFQSAYLGFYSMAEYAGKGYMSAGLKLLLEKTFTEHSLHRLEANIQPQNTSSILLIKANGFKKEGYSPRYLKINETWCDHERWALTYEDWVKN